MLHQGLPGEHLSRLGGQETDQVVLPLGQLQGAAVLVHRGPLQVHHHPAHVQPLSRFAPRLGRLRGGHGHPPDIGLDPGQQLPHGEGLGDIVVRPQLQTQDLVGLLLPGGEHEDGHGRPRLPDLPAHVKSVHPRQHQVQQDQVRVLFQSQLQAGIPVIGLQGIVPLPAEVEGQNIHDVLLVFHDQNGLSQLGSLPYRFKSTLVFKTVATVLASSRVPSITFWNSSSKGMVTTFKNSSSSG